MRRKNQTKHGGFTLLELLVAIGIIALLAAILLPVFSAARDKSRQITCASNLRQLGVAFSLYRDDYDGVFPLPGSPDEYDTSQDGPYWDVGDPHPQGGLSPYAARTSDASGGSVSVWFCPSLPKYFESDVTDPVAAMSYKRFTKRTYSMNWYLRDPNPDGGTAEIGCDNPNPQAAGELYKCAGAYKTPLSEARLIAPAATLLLFEGVQVRGSSYAGPYLGPARRSGDFSFERGYMRTADRDVYAAQEVNSEADGNKTTWHGGNTNNVLYCDNHVKNHVLKPFPWHPSAGDNEWYVARFR